MADGKDYHVTKAFSYLNKISNEKPLQIREILKVVKTMSKRDIFLDIGAGTGDVFFPITKYFKKNIAIEPGERIFKILKDKGKNYHEELELIKTSWDDFYKNNEERYAGKIDLIIGIHIVYFFKDLKKTLKEIISLLSPNGKLVLICAYGEDQKKDFVHYLRHKITGSKIILNPAFSKLKKMFPENCAVDKKLRVFFTLNNLELLESGRHLSKENEATNYFLKFAFKKWFDELTEQDKKAINDFVEKYKRKNGKKYVVQSLQRVYVFKR